MPNLNHKLFSDLSESNVQRRPKRYPERSLFIPLDDEKTFSADKFFNMSTCFE